MKNILLRLRETQSAMSGTEATIAQYICAHPEEAANLPAGDPGEGPIPPPPA